MSKRPHQEYDKSESEIEALVSKQLTAHPKKSESIEDEPTTRLKMAKILKDYKDDTMDYIRTAQALEALYKQRIDLADVDGRLSELKKLPYFATSASLYEKEISDRIKELERTRAGINKKEEV